MNDAPVLARSAKDEVRAMLDRLPDDLTLDDIAYHLGVLKLIREREANDRPENDRSQDEVMEQLRTRLNSIVRRFR